MSAAPPIAGDRFASPELLVALSPVRAYASFARRAHAQGDGLRVAVARTARWMLLLALLVSFLDAGRATILHVASPFLFWLYLPALQLVALVIALRTFTPRSARDSDAPDRTPLARAYALFRLGDAPWIVFLFGVVLFLFVTPDVGRSIRGAWTRIPLLAGFVATIALGGRTTYGFFRAAIALPRRRAIGATIVFYVVAILLFASWYVAAGQLLPLLLQR